MSLYIELQKGYKVHRGKSIGVFSPMHGEWNYYYNNKKNVLFPNRQDQLDDYKSILEYAEKNRITEFKIKVDPEWYHANLFSKDSDSELIWLFYQYVLDKDITIGLILPHEHVYDRIGVYEDLGIPVAVRTTPESSGSPKEKCLVSSKPNLLPRNKRGVEPRTTPEASLSVASVFSFDGVRLEESFHEKLMKYLVESKKTNTQIYQTGGISKQVFSKIISTPDMIPTKSTVVCLSIGLGLRLKETIELLDSAGYSLSKSIPSDVIVMRYISKEIYDIDRINIDLCEYGCPLLGWHPRDK